MMRVLRPYLILAAGVVAVTLLSFTSEGLNFYDQRIVITIGISMILATSLNLINGFTGQFSLGHAGFMSVGAYSAAALSTMALPALGIDPSVGLEGELAFFVIVVAGGCAAAIAGALVGIPSLRLKGDYLAIVTLGFGEIIRVILQNVNTGTISGPLGISSIPHVTSFTWVFCVVVVVVFVVQMIMSTTYGKGFLAVRDDEIAAESLGIDTTRYKVTAFVAGAFFAGVAGALYAHYNGLIRPDDFNFLKSVEIVVMVILGGMGSTWGVLLAAAILTYLPEWLRDMRIGSINLGDFRMTIYALVLIILMLVRPQGLFGGVRLSRLVSKRASGRRTAADS